jgi:drug/metabolite transporter (DMT)-like permease
MNRYHIVLLISVCLSGFSQILLKRGASVVSMKNRFAIYINPYTILGYTILFAVTLVNLYIFKHIQMSLIIMFLPITYIIIASFSYILFHEKITAKKIIASVLIISGIILYYLK